MSGNNGAATRRMTGASAKTDRRILRTRDALGDALVALMQEKPFDAITIQHVLDRAGVGRSTFYAHYRDKDDLFLSDVEEFFVLMASLLDRSGAPAGRVAPVRELFAHVADASGVHAALVASGKLHDVLELGRGIFARSIEERLRAGAAGVTPPLLKAHAHGLAGNLFSLLDWWINSGMTVPPDEMDALFHRMVWAGVGSRPT